SLADYFYTQAKSSLLAGMVAGTFKTTESLTTVLLGIAHLKEPLSAGNKLLGDLLSTDDLIDKTNIPPVKPAITPGAFPHQFETLRLLQKLSRYASGLGLRADEIAWLLDHSEALGWLELDHIPYQSGQPSQSLAKWEMLVGAMAMVKDYPAIVNPDDNANAITGYSFFELVLAGGTTINDVAAYLSRLAGWDETLVKSLDGYFALSTPDLSSYQDPSTFRKLERAIVFLRRLGADLTTGQTYLKARLTTSEVQTLRQALKSNYSDADWLGVLKGIQDPLREQKRDALVAYLLAVNPDLKDSNDLYDIFMIDTQMSACGPTSRIVQAHGTLQLFVQRCLLGLEPTAVADAKLDQGWKQWQWMENYRVWEANRKVFVYPENWIEPELRDDKSPFFEDIETFFKQNELTEHNVEDATASYLEKLDDIALLEVQAVYYQTDIFTMHVFARTRGGDPYNYYYRRFEKERSWTPWEKVDLDISGDHLMAFVRNSRLYLAWPVFTEDADTNPDIPLPSAGSFGTGKAQKSVKRWKLQMAISEFNGKKWLPKKISRDALVGNQWYNRLPERADFHFMPLDLGVAGFGFMVTFLDNGVDAYGNPGSGNRRLMGSFSLTGCKGVPVPYDGGGVYFPLTFLPDFKETSLSTQHFTEFPSRTDNDLAIRTILNPYKYAQILQNTPGRFKVTYPFQMSLIDWLLALLYFLLMSRNTYMYKETAARRGFLLPLGTFMPWFFEDYSRVYAVVPGFYSSDKQQEAGQVIEKTFSDILIFTQKAVNLALIYWGKLQADPAHDLQKLLDELVKDDTFQDLLKELGEFMASQYGYKFKNFYHPLVCYLRETLYKNGIPGLMQPEVQLQDTGFDFSTAQNYNPTLAVIKPYPREDIDFARDGGYAGYNWELFFHLPFETAVKLSQDQQFEAAMDWFHYIFNPLGARDGMAPQKYWVTKPFFQHTTSDYVSQRIDTILNKLATGVGVDDLKYAVSEWRDKPFMPHVIARSRLVAYQKAVVMKYLDNLIAWGDYLFRQDTMESVNQATQFYVLADRLLGPKPRLVPPAVDTPPETYSQLESKLDVFGNALLDLENLVPDLGLLPHGGAELPPAPITLSSLYFCIPQNENLLAYWDLVGDRLFKIRNCQNIDGVERQLALFAPPIDPGALVRAAAAGLSVADILKGLNAPLPAYRFKVMVKKAQELAQQVNGLGSALLQALEKRDSEKLGLLRSSQEIQLLQAVRAYKKMQVDEAQVQIEAVQKSIDVTQARMDYYRSRPFMSPGEQAAQDLNTLAAGLQIAASSMDIAATVAHLIPDLNIGASGFGGSPHASAKFGGINFGNSSMTAADMLRSLAGNFQILAGLTSTQAGYQRRKDDWDFQGDQASKEIVQLQRQQLAAEIRHDLADMDVQNQDLQITNAQAVDAYLHDKFTNDELYDWMVGQISGVYFQAYQLALNIARKAERCYRHELGRDDSFIAAGYWDNLKKGLQAADQLVYDLNRMETAYLDQNKREYELTKHASLVQIDPLALAELKSKGKCTFTLPEAVFDLDQPGHYFRRLKSVSLSIPCVTGPYTSVSAKLSLVSNKYRKVTTLNAGGPKDSYVEDPGNDNRFAYNLAGIQSIATSRAQEDSGLFELNFSDERYLPFEGAGAISVWQLELPDKLRTFDYNTISDVIVHLKYTARDGGGHFKSIVEQALFELLNEMVLSASKTGLYQAFSLRQSFAEAFYMLKTDKTLTMQITEQMLPFYTEDHTPNLEGVTFLARLKNNPASYAMTLNAAALNLTKTPTYGNLCTGTPMPNPLSLATDFTLAAANTDDLEDLMIVVRYTLAS
ncbi:MAG: hypothetical protein H6Q37_1355, partial [Chloroflexi bacterium]|nr:hypothetical protein [Chloroflexota bacterium]